MTGKNTSSQGEFENLVERRIAEAKLTIAESRLHFALWFGGAAIAVFGVFIPMFQASNASRDVAAAIERTEQRSAESAVKVDQAIEKMRLDFERLAGDALKNPEIIIQYDGGSLDSKEIPMDSVGRIDFKTLVLVNQGDKACETLSVRIYFENPTYSEFGGGEWQSLPSPDPAYKSVLWTGSTAKISPSEKWVLPNPSFRSESIKEIKDSYSGMIEVFYGIGAPVVTHFKIVPENKKSGQ